MHKALKIVGGLAVVVVSFVVTDWAMDWVAPRCPSGERFELKRPFGPNGGRAFYADLPPAFESVADNVSSPNRSPLQLCEGNMPIGPPHALHAEIVQKGGGRFSHWDKQIIFSSSDGSNPNGNGYSYTAVKPKG
jgi:hypothetical protein